MDDRRLGEFLRARRAAVRPQDVGLPDAGRRRVPGLRREELALLAGIGVSYYTRLEQGQAHNASPEVLDALARVLGLDEFERAHLTRLTGPGRRRGGGRDSEVEQVPAATREVLHAVGEVPALVLGRRADVLAWNALGHALVAGHLDPTAPDRPAERPNLARLHFLDPHGRDLYVDWRRKARATVSNLRLLAGQYPADARLTALIGELTIGSPEFATLWADHRVRPCEGEVFTLRHPTVGTLTATQHALQVPRSPGQALILFTTAADSASAHALTLLAAQTHTRPTPRPAESATGADVRTSGREGAGG
ncbi:helix-turn-helix transcriptional regulator [Streptomyces sp. HSW2009]|uniref:helix-turn-helix domain-containing protein n=1 Tax=Streptomyces sp. HSW2009 TaxID=3142890 RepID=UPI0032ED09B0